LLLRFTHMHARVAAVAVVAGMPLIVAAAAEAPSRRAVAHAAEPKPARVAIRPSAEPRLVAWGGAEEARRWARRRSGTVAFAVLTPGGKIRGLQVNRRFPSASVVKAMLALAVLRSARDRPLTGEERALLTPMITVSDNDAASTIYRRVGGAGLTRVAQAAGMTRFLDVGNWADAQLTAGDQVRLFLQIDRLAPRRHRSFLRHLLGSIVPSQRWGVAAVADARGFHIMFKGGWRTAIAHQSALVERDGTRAALAVLTSGSPSDAYGRETEAGIASRVLAGPPKRRRVAAGA
jgi:beta-lactamase family protein